MNKIPLRSRSAKVDLVIFAGLLVSGARAVDRLCIS